MFGYDSDEDEVAFHPFVNPMRQMLLEHMLRRQLGVMAGGYRESEESTEPAGFVKEHLRTNKNAQEKYKVPDQTFVDLFSPFIDDWDGCDILLEANGVLYPVHSVILGAWSNPSLKKIEESFMKGGKRAGQENKEEDSLVICLNLSKEESEVFPLFLKYLYTERIELEYKKFLGVLTLSRSLGVIDLYRECLFYLEEFIRKSPLNSILLDIWNRIENMGGSVMAMLDILLSKFLQNISFSSKEFIEAMDVDLLCTLLKSSDLVTTNEFSLFTTVFPKMITLKDNGNTHSLVRLQSLLRLTQCSAEQLQEMMTHEVMQDFEANFPGYFRNVLYQRAVYLEQDDPNFYPLSLEEPRLYLEYPLPVKGEQRHMSYSQGRTDVPKFINVTVQNGKQHLSTHIGNTTGGFTVYQRQTYGQGLSRCPSREWTLHSSHKISETLTYELEPYYPADGQKFKVVVAVYLGKHGYPPQLSVFDVICTGDDRQITVDTGIPTPPNETEFKLQVAIYACDERQPSFRYEDLEKDTFPMPPL